MTNIAHITRCGLPGLDRIPMGMHACHFHRTRDQLLAVLAPYAIAGLRNDERCLLVAGPQLPAHDLLEALRAEWDGIDQALQAGALRIVDAASLSERDLVPTLLAEEEGALAQGYSGLRVAGSATHFAARDWSTFLECERTVSARLNGRRIVALCSYAATRCTDRQMSDVMRAHHCALEGPDVDGQMYAVPEFPRGSWSRW